MTTHYYLYQITNNLNGKIYVGVHKTSNIDDGYMGSGKLIKLAIKKYGNTNFTKVILETFENEKAMYTREKEIVTEEFIKRSDVYNLCCGGIGGFSHINDSSDEHIQIAKRGYLASLAKIDLSAQGKRTAEMLKSERRGVFSDDYVSSWSNNKELQQMGNTPEAREKAKVTVKATFEKIGHQQGEKNSSFGTCWISNELVGSKKCKKEDLPLYIEQGWVKGRNVFKLISLD